MQLRPYQKQFIDDIRRKFSAGIKNVCGVAPCGAGKTVITAFMVREATARGKRSVFFVHRHELIEQTAATFAELDIPFGIVSAGYEPNYELPVQIASVQTLVNRMSEILEPDFLICDECHHILAKSYKKIIKCWGNAYLLGLTATPQRMGGVNLGDVFSALVEAPDVKALTRIGCLAPFNYYAPDFNLDFSSLHVRRGDFVNSEAAKLMGDEKVIADVVWNYKLHAAGKSAICYCVNIEHSKLVAERFNKAGIIAAQVDGETPKAERQQIVNDFRAGKITILCNAELFGEGFDLPAMDAVILARPTKSLTLFIQQAMRPLRPDPTNKEKVATIIDCANNYSLFGLPDEKRYWSLAKNPPKTPTPPPMKICPQCSLVVPAGLRKCECGYIFPSKEIVERKITTSLIPRDFQAFLRIAEQRNYKKSWAVFRFLETKPSLSDLIKVRDFMGYKKGWENHHQSD